MDSPSTPAGHIWHWFNHPEMQARIAAAEADRREGRVEKFDSREAALAALNSLA
jgi:hypothetical protein